MSALIEADRVSKAFGGLQALSECSLSVPKGSIAGLIGRASHYSRGSTKFSHGDQRVSEKRQTVLMVTSFLRWCA